MKIKLNRIAAILATILLLVVHSVQATADGSDILEHNLHMSEAWVNWYSDAPPSSSAVKELAERLKNDAGGIEGVPSLVHDWICENIYFDRDAFESGAYSTLAASDVIEERRGVCEAISNLVQALLIEAGIPCIKVWGYASTEKLALSADEIDILRINHTWNEFYLGGRWITMDCTADMGNSYKGGSYVQTPWGSDYLDPIETFFAETHVRLRRGFDLPENIPTEWAVSEITNAVDRGLIPIELLSRYRLPITERELWHMLGVENGGDMPIRRCDAAVIIASHLGITDASEPPYQDVSSCTEEEQTAIAAIHLEKIMIGTGELEFSPDQILTRQEAICILARIYEKYEEETPCT